MNPSIEDLVMAHRYMYYVLAETVLPDHQYDILERQGRLLLPDTSPVQRVGSDLSSSYTEYQINLARKLLNAD